MTFRSGKEILSTHDAAKICRVTPMTVIRWIEEGKIPAFKTAGGHRRILRQDLERFCRASGIPFLLDENPSNGRILVVDADAAIRELVAEAARAVDQRLMIEMAGDPFTAGRLIASFRPSLLFLDHRLAGIDAPDLVAALSRDPETATVAICVLSAAYTPDLDRALRARGAVACLKRPPNVDEVDRLVRSTFRIPDAGRTHETSVIVIGDARGTRTLRRDLEQAIPGARVSTFESCIDALLAIGAERPDVVILDVSVSDLDCVEVIRRVQRRAGNKPLAMIAAADPGQEALRTPLTAAGASQFLIKPLTVEKLAPAFSLTLPGGPTAPKPRSRRTR